MFWNLCVFYVCGNFLLSVSEAADPRADLGYPRGLMSVCPGSNKSASIPRSQLRHLTFVLQGVGRSRRRYTFWQSKDIALDPRMQFKRKTMVIASGYLDSPNFLIAAMFANEYEDRGYNVIMVDYQRFATVHYHLASRLMRPIGKHIGEVLADLTAYGLDPGRLELLGFSLGGQMISYVAKSYQRLTNRNISALIALEPSGPCFRTLDPNDRLDKSDADFVQVVHTNIDGFGMASVMGHVDFYINGGEYQPSDLNFYPCESVCSHFRVLSLWLSALKNPGKFVAIKCNSVQQARDAVCYDNIPLITNVMGEDVNRNKGGIFYLSTGLGYPFHLGSKGLKKEYVYWKRITDVNDNNETEIFT